MALGDGAIDGLPLAVAGDDDGAMVGAGDRVGTDVAAADGPAAIAEADAGGRVEVVPDGIVRPPLARPKTTEAPKDSARMISDALIAGVSTAFVRTRGVATSLATTAPRR